MANTCGAQEEQSPNFPYLSFATITQQDGLPTSDITWLERDRQGLIWLGSKNGLFRYDGFRFKRFVVANDNLSSPTDIDGRVYFVSDSIFWLNTNRGVSMVNKFTGKVVHYGINEQGEKSLYKANVELNRIDNTHVLFVDAAKNGCIADSSGIIKKTPFHYADSFAGKYNTNFSNPLDCIGKLYMDKQGRFWTTQWRSKHISRLTKDFSGVDKIITLPFINLVSINFLYFDEYNQCWISTEGSGLCMIDMNNESIKNIPVKEAIDFENIVDYRDASGNHWLASVTDVGLLLIDPISKKYTLYKNEGNPGGFNTDFIGQLFTDKENILWAITNTGLIYNTPFMQINKTIHFDKTSLAKLHYTSSDIYATALSFAGDTAYLEINNQQLLSYNGTFSTCTAYYNTDAIEILKDNYHQYWVSWNGGIALCDKPMQPVKYFLPDLSNHKSPDAYNFKKLKMISDSIMLVSSADAVYLFNVKTKKYIKSYYAGKAGDKYKAFPYFKTLRSTWYNGSNKIWMAFNGDEKLYWINIKTDEFHIVSSKFFEMITRFTPDKKGNLWLTTTQGLLTYNTIAGAITTYVGPQQPDLMDIKNICTDSIGNIWIKTANDLYAYEPGKSQFFKVNSGGEINESNSTKTLQCMPDGNVFNSQQGGFTIFNPSYCLSLPQRAIITETSINDSTVNWLLANKTQKQISIPYNSGQFKIHFSSPYYNTIHNTQYYYRILKNDSVWRKLDKGEISFINLAPDNFILQVATKLSPSENELDNIQIEIIPPFYKAPWFFILSVLAGMIILFTVFYVRLLVIKKRTDLEKEILAKDSITSAFKQKLADTELSAIRSQMNPHFIFNCLNSIKLYTEQNNSKAASEYVTKFSMLIRLVLENSQSERISLAKELQALELYIQMESMRFKDKLQYEMLIDENIDTEYIEIPPLLLQPYLENAIWHGLMHKEEGGSIHLEISKNANEDRLTITITDNGIGRTKAMELKSKSATRHKSFGMKLTQDRIALINQMYKTNTAVRVTDLFTENGDAAGTMVVIQIPIA